MYQQNNNRKKKSMHFPAVMFFGLIITCVVVIVAVSGKNLLHKGDDLLQGKDSGTTLAEIGRASCRERVFGLV